MNVKENRRGSLLILNKHERKPKGAIKYEQSRKTGNICRPRHNTKKSKIKAQHNTNNINKTWAFHKLVAKTNPT